MQDHPPLPGNGYHRRDDGAEQYQTHDSGISLWIAAATVIISLGVLLVFSQGQLKNGGGPFVITPPTEISAYPASGL
ncbi:hypothetical protein [Hoeflea alexandrii]|uniref:Uncharacterized protein n=1 Tax=Hoeflea alexandrii TaxID=288436 RepID=A0ABT1CPB1_9HYPH|nr:hypothetical protein [Hoeflea alexandrii]MCO6407968.1 hypothetical protein [Hoeflea alexandrii]MCY0153683.1 hypothetical protein [Hoeflea alexandrii]